MAKQVIGIGASANDRSGDPIRTGFDKANQNFTELYNVSTSLVATQTSLVNVSTSTVAVSTSLGNVSTSLGNVSTSTANTTSSLGNVSTSLAGQSTSNAGQSTSIANISSSLGTVSTSLGAVSTSLGNVSTSLTSVSTTVANIPLVDTVAVANAMTFDASVKAIRTAGYYAAGDLGDELYVRASSAPAHGNYITSNGGTVFWEPRSASGVSVLAAGARPGRMYYAVASITAGTNALTVTGAALTATDVGKTVWVQYAGGGGAPLVTTIAAIVSGTQATLAANAVATVANNDVFIGYDDTVAIKKAAASMSPYGDKLLVPFEHGFSDPDGLVLGDGTSTTASTKVNFIIQGNGISTGSVAFKNLSGCALHYIGAGIGNAMLDVKGPTPIEINRILFNGNYRTNIGLRLRHIYLSKITQIHVLRCIQKTVEWDAYPGGAETYLGNSENVVTDSHFSGVGVIGHVCVDLGEDNFTAVGGLTLDASRITFRDCSFAVSDNAVDWLTTGASTSTCIRLQFTDNIVFDGCFTYISGLRRGNSILIKPPSGAAPAGAYPAEISWKSGALVGRFAYNLTNNPWEPWRVQSRGIHFSALNTGDAQDPTGGRFVAPLPDQADVGNNSGVSGYDSRGLNLSAAQLPLVKQNVLLWSSTVLARGGASVVNTTTPTNIFTFAMPAGFMRSQNLLTDGLFVWNRVLRLEGHWDFRNDTGSAVTIRLRVKVGSVVMLDSLALTIPTSAFFRALFLKAQIRATAVDRASGRMELDIGVAASTGSLGQAGAIDLSRMAGTSARVVDWTAAQTITVEAELSVASAVYDMYVNGGQLELL
jgi:hypothetical protein